MQITKEVVFRLNNAGPNDKKILLDIFRKIIEYKSEGIQNVEKIIYNLDELSGIVDYTNYEELIEKMINLINISFEICLLDKIIESTSVVSAVRRDADILTVEINAKTTKKYYSILLELLENN